MNTKMMAVFGLLLASVPALLASAAPARSNVYRHKKLGIEFTVPEEGFALTPGKNKKDEAGGTALCDFATEEKDLGGFLYYIPAGLTVEKFAKANEDGFRKRDFVKSVKQLKSQKLNRKSGKWILREYDVKTDGKKKAKQLRLFVVYIADGQHNFLLLISVNAALLEERQEAIDAILTSLKYGPAAESDEEEKKEDEDTDTQGIPSPERR